MKHFLYLSFFFCCISVLSGCREKVSGEINAVAQKNEARYASGLAIYSYKGFSIVKISNPWPKAAHSYTYILKKVNGTIPDSLGQYPVINVPVRRIAVSSTTHIPSLEMLGKEQTLVGFPNLSYISSERVRALIDKGKIKELGSNQNLNIEAAIDLHPDVFIGNGIDNNNPALDNLQKAGIRVMLNGDWNEKTPLGRAEWIKFFGALYDEQDKANSLFATIEDYYGSLPDLIQKNTRQPTVLSGSMYQNVWNLPQGDSWGALLIKDAGGDYLWKEAEGTGSLSLPFETVFEKAQNADYWIGPGQYTSLKEMAADNPHFAQFKAFKNKKIYSFSTKKGKTGGILYYELAPNRPDLVLKDIIKILHPDLLPGYQLTFFEALQ